MIVQGEMHMQNNQKSCRTVDERFWKNVRKLDIPFEDEFFKNRTTHPDREQFSPIIEISNKVRNPFLLCPLPTDLALDGADIDGRATEVAGFAHGFKWGRGLENAENTDPGWEDGFQTVEARLVRMYLIRTLSTLWKHNTGPLTYPIWTPGTLCTHITGPLNDPGEFKKLLLVARWVDVLVLDGEEEGVVLVQNSGEVLKGGTNNAQQQTAIYIRPTLNRPRPQSNPILLSPKLTSI